MRLCLAVIATFAATAAFAEDLVRFSVPSPISAYSGGPGIAFEQQIVVPVSFAFSGAPDLVTGSDTTPNPAAIGIDVTYEAAIRTYEAAMRAFEANQAARAAAQRALDTVYPARMAAYRADLASWRLCRRQPLVRCGSEPERPSRPRIPASLPRPEPPERPDIPSTIDTRSGPLLQFDVAGETWTTLDFSMSYGTIDPELTYRLGLSAPDDISADKPFHLEVTSLLTGGQLDGSSPTYNAVLSQSLRIDRGSLSFAHCIRLMGCDTFANTALHEGEEATVIVMEANPQGATFFGHVLDERFIRAEMSGLELEVSAGLDLRPETGGNPVGITVNGISIPPSLTVALGTEIATGRILYPILEIPGELVDGEIRGRAQSEFFSFDLDVDTATQLIGGATIGNDLYSAGGDLWDITAGPRVDPYQTMTLVPELTLSLAFDTPVMIDGVGTTTTWSGSPESLPEITVTADTTVTPTWSVVGHYHSELGISFRAEIEIELIIMEYSFATATVEYGPFAPEIPVLATEPIETMLIETGFPVISFSTFTGAPVQLRPSN